MWETSINLTTAHECKWLFVSLNPPQYIVFQVNRRKQLWSNKYTLTCSHRHLLFEWSTDKCRQYDIAKSLSSDRRTTTFCQTASVHTLLSNIDIVFFIFGLGGHAGKQPFGVWSEPRRRSATRRPRCVHCDASPPLPHAVTAPFLMEFSSNRTSGPFSSTGPNQNQACRRSRPRGPTLRRSTFVFSRHELYSRRSLDSGTFSFVWALGGLGSAGALWRLNGGPLCARAHSPRSSGFSWARWDVWKCGGATRTVHSC